MQRHEIKNPQRHAQTTQTSPRHKNKKPARRRAEQSYVIVHSTHSAAHHSHTLGNLRTLGRILSTPSSHHLPEQWLYELPLQFPRPQPPKPHYFVLFSSQASIVLLIHEYYHKQVMVSNYVIPQNLPHINKLARRPSISKFYQYGKLQLISSLSRAIIPQSIHSAKTHNNSHQNLQQAIPHEQSIIHNKLNLLPCTNTHPPCIHSIPTQPTDRAYSPTPQKQRAQ